MTNYMNDLLKIPYENLVSIAKSSFKKVYDYASEVVDTDNAGALIVTSIFTCVNADYSFSLLERRFCDEIFGDGMANLIQNTKLEQDEAVEILMKVAQVCPDDIRQELGCFCLAFLAVDRRFTEAEVDMFNKIFG